VSSNFFTKPCFVVGTKKYLILDGLTDEWFTDIYSAELSIIIDGMSEGNTQY